MLPPPPPHAPPLPMMGPPAPPLAPPVDEFAVESRGDLRLAVGAVAVGVALDVAQSNGVVTVAGCALTIVTALALIGSGRSTSWCSRALLGVAAFLSFAMVFRTSEWVILPTGAAIVVVVALAVSFAQEPRLRFTFPVVAGRLAMIAGHLTLAPGMLRMEPGDDSPGEEARRGRVIALVRGLTFALPVVIVVGALLASADPVFESWFDPPLLLRNLALLIIGAWVLTGLARAASATTPIPPIPPAPGLGTTEVLSVLGALSAVYAAFVVARVVASAGGAAHVLETRGLTYAEYARTGFFQLLAAASITLIVLLSVRACADRRRWSVVIVSELTIALTLAVVVAAVQRLDLYESAYGLTMLRLACTIVAVWIGGVFLMLALAVARRDSAGHWFAPALVLSAVVLVGGWAIANPAVIVADTNLDRAASHPFDVRQAATLGPDAVPTLLAGIGQLVPAQRDGLRDELCTTGRSRGGFVAERGVAYNRAESLADQALAPVCRD